MASLLEYKTYLGSVEYSEEDELLHGRLMFIRDLVTYEGTDAKALKTAFHEAVDDYLALCESQGRTPDKPLKGTFNVRPGELLHRRAMLYAQREGLNLNNVVSEALKRYLDEHEQSASAGSA
jgi:predicted HicB family RNase H-like nuclease